MDIGYFLCLWECIAKVLNPEDARHLGRGRDCQGSDPYNKLQLRRAWRIENFYLWKKFQHETWMNGEILEHPWVCFSGWMQRKRCCSKLGGMLLDTSRGVLACVGMQRSSHDLVFLAQVFIWYVLSSAHKSEFLLVPSLRARNHQTSKSSRRIGCPQCPRSQFGKNWRKPRSSCLSR